MNSIPPSCKFKRSASFIVHANNKIVLPERQRNIKNDGAPYRACLRSQKTTSNERWSAFSTDYGAVRIISMLSAAF